MSALFKKVFVEVTAHFDTDGKMTPLSFLWEDGTKYEINRIFDVRPAASLKAGGQGTRYKCRVMGRETCLFFDGERWFMEGKDQTCAEDI